MLHPRVPPLVRALPHVEVLSLFRAEEGHEEKDARREAGFVTIEEIRATENVRDEIVTEPESVAVDAPSVARSQPLQPARSFASSYTAHSDAAAASHNMANAGSGTCSSAVKSSSPDTPNPATELPNVVRTPATTPAFLPPPPTPSTLPGTPDLLPSSSTIDPSISVRQGASMAVAEPQSIPAVMQMDVAEDEDEPMPGIDLGSDSETD